MAQGRFGRPGGHDVAEAAQRRLDLLRRELAQAGLPSPGERPEDASETQPGTGPGGRPGRHPGGRPPGAAPVADPGRHARRRPPGLLARSTGWLADRLPPTLQGRVRLGAAQAGLVAALAGVGLVVAAVAVLRSGSGGAALPVSRSVPAHAAGASARPLVPVASAAAPAAATPGAGIGTAGAAPGASAGASGGAGVVVVDVAGKVRHPGVVRLPAGSRVVDALRRAGGARAGVATASLNLARVLVDGEQILVGVRPPPGVAAAAAPGATATSTGTAAPLVNINTATLEGLEELPGVGPVTAQKILDWRTAHGSFSSVDELLEVDGIGEKTLADLAPYVTL